MKVSVTGANGFLGQNIVKLFLKEGHDVIAWVRHPLGFNFQCRTFDLEKIDQADFSHSEILIHCAAYLPKNFWDISEAEKCMTINGDATLKLLQSAEKAGVKKFVYLSSGQIYSWKDLGSEALEEDSVWPTERATPYLISKTVGDLYVNSHKGNMQTVTLRPSHIYGPGMKLYGILHRMYNMLQNGDLISTNNVGHYDLDLVYVDDVAQMAHLVATQNVTGVFNVGGGQALSTIELVRTLARIMNTACTIAPTEIKYGGHPALNIDKAKNVGYIPIDLRVGLRNYVESLKGIE